MEIFFKSIAAGIVTGIILLIAKYSGPRMAGAIGGIPIVFAITYVILMLQNKTTNRDYLVGGVYGAIAAIFFSVICILLNSYSKNLILNFVVAYGLCFLFAYVMVAVTSK